MGGVNTSSGVRGTHDLDGAVTVDKLLQESSAESDSSDDSSDSREIHERMAQLERTQTTLSKRVGDMMLEMAKAYPIFHLIDKKIKKENELYLKN